MFEKNKNIIVAVVITAVISGGAGFYAGKSIGSPTSPSASFGQNMQGGQFGQGMPGGLGANGRTGASRMGGGFVSGEIIAKDDTSITVETKGGQSGQASSKIVFLSGSTEISKSAEGTPSDLVIGQQITTTGTTNTDGSLTAKTVQIRPEMNQPKDGAVPTLPQ